MGKDMVTSFRVNEELWKRTRVYAIENDLTVKKLMESLLKMELKEKKLAKEMKKE